MKALSKDKLPTDYYMVDKIIGKKKIGNIYKYRVKWKNYPIENSTWEPIDNLKFIKNKIDQFENGYKIRRKILKLARKNKNIPKENEKKDASEDSKIKIDSNKKKIKKKRVSIKDLNESPNSTKNNLIINSAQPVVIELPFNEGLKPIYEGILDKDTPSKILYAKYVPGEEEIYCLIEWNKNNNGQTPDPSYYSVSEIRRKYYDLLIDYYQSKIYNSNSLIK